MCGINGIFAYHTAANPPREAELLATREAMRARGPDGAGVWWNGDRRCGFGHRRLSIIDLSERATQPMASADERYVVVFNGEIYNYPALRAELETQGAQFRTASDTEALLHLYRRDGAEMVHRLRGMYAFAIWDNEKRGLFLARDPYGIKPLYTANDGWTFRFASQVKALLTGSQISRDPEPAGLVGFHLFGHLPEPFTLYREIRALPSGHFQWVDETGPREPQRFTNLAAILAEGAMHPVAPSELAERLRQTALDSVRAHLLADVEVGVFLSAGIDSGALLGLMRDAGQERIRAITLGFDEFAGTAEDEVPLASEVARHYGAEHIVRRVGAREFREDLPAILEAMDQPSIDGVNTWFVSKAAKEVGLKVALSGLGGDELLAGYPSFCDIPRWRRRYGAFASVPFLGRAARTLMQMLMPDFARAQPKALGMLEYAGSWAGAYLLRRGLYLPDELPALLGEDVTREGLRRLSPLRTIEAQLDPNPASQTGRVCVLESSNYMRNQLLRDSDWAGMAHGLEIRVPLVDWRLTSFLAPDIPSLAPGAGKAALACAPSLALPAVVRRRAKTGFSVPTGGWGALPHQSHAAAKPKLRFKGQASRLWLLEVYGATAPSRTGQPMLSH
ncbi:MAG: asparagine synthase (glutamine-hydrolyzing) [Alphaproteobacteria bacterium]|nr:asparagine synthase (glutamine-hydrolyzing) [Alphaproteobacteria bacterium]MDE2111495.1 asparagine synthase (glutamine-hydrolyzing) [Alphaproteobacteria bacterium]MDE2493960.1 asparagine synthase (glutamine-hydrolyzing) [Alphaproteobacteria bacterium]